MAGPILSIDFLRQFKVTVAPETSRLLFACTAVAPSAPKSFLPSFDSSVPLSVLPSSGTTQPVSALSDRIPQVKPTSFCCQGNQSIKDPPPPPVLPAFEPKQLQPIQDSVAADVKILLQKYPSIFRTWVMKPTPTHGVEHHIHTGSHPQFFAMSRRLDPEKLEIVKAEFKRLEALALFVNQNLHGHLPCA
jgi:hypothetical protein